MKIILRYTALHKSYKVCSVIESLSFFFSLYHIVPSLPFCLWTVCPCFLLPQTELNFWKNYSLGWFSLMIRIEINVIINFLLFFRCCVGSYPSSLMFFFRVTQRRKCSRIIQLSEYYRGLIQQGERILKKKKLLRNRKNKYI